MASALVIGSTGKTGSHILSTLLSLPPSQVSSVQTISRRLPPQASEKSSSTTTKLNAHIEKDTSKWESLIPSLSPIPQIVYSALATTRGDAGGFDKQYLIDHDLNVDLAKKVKEAGVQTYVLISAGGADATSVFGYQKMKGETERDIQALEFQHTVFVRPGLITGRREGSRPAETALKWIADGLGYVSGGLLKDGWAQDGDVIGRAAVRAGLKAQRGEYKDKVHIVQMKEILELGRQPLTELEKSTL
ncbi:Protein fmp52, mitochondrial [Lithohypha guttulata]|uniref:Protein fmp52, mitochondrial n=1 Tax=Lithohypha guttulata TaxID=1690604 RepID=A0AAN7YF00_9EURO|nr:Protein fmp52, mitochondrial [Lithohypha guttulata]KAK5083899.1 Protein fmp52, mitochondrial [Lithohypha guttulata]KAK5098195.1 Protein fmp52, mitochondrial [Lithohypha guttulata]